jgi:hypothetical protein
MVRGTPVTLSTRKFQKKGDASDYFKAMLNRYRPGERVSSSDSEDLSALLIFHDEYSEKVGIGIDHFEVMKAEYNTKCFCIVRSDGSHIDFSYVHCISQIKK